MCRSTDILTCFMGLMQASYQRRTHDRPICTRADGGDVFRCRYTEPDTDR